MIFMSTEHAPSEPSFTVPDGNPESRPATPWRAPAAGDGEAAPDKLVNLNEVSLPDAPRLTVVIPTRNERANIGPLLARLGPVVAAMGAELILVDDSDDDTPQVASAEAADCPIPVRLLHRSPGNRKGGLSSAVIAGARQADGEWVLVM